MMTITVEHKHCKCTRTVKGNTLYNAFKDNGLDLNTWIVIDIKHN